MRFDRKKSVLGSVSCFASAIGLLGLTTVLVTGLPRAVQADEAVQVQPRQHIDGLLRVKTVVEVAGSLKVDAGKERVRSIPLKVDAELFYDQRGLRGEHSPMLRHHWKAEAQLEVGGEKTVRTLRPERQVVRLFGDLRNERLSSPLGPMSRDELDLLDIAGNLFPVEDLLPEDTVSKGDSWQHSSLVAEQLLGLDEISDGQLTSKITEVSEQMIKMTLEGKLKASVAGTNTKLEVVGNYHFDRKAGVVSWLALALKERRDSSLTAPGFNVTARIRSARKAVDSSPVLNNEAIAGYEAQPQPGDQMVDFSEAEYYQMALDRRWHILSRRAGTTTLRMVDEDDLLATCKVDRLDPLPAGRELSLDGFRKDVQQALGNNAQSIVAASEDVNGQGVRCLRVVVAGTVSKAPIHWIYYHCSNPTGERLSVIFTHEATQAERFAGGDQSLISSVRLLERAQPDGEPVDDQPATALNGGVGEVR